MSPSAEKYTPLKEKAFISVLDGSRAKEFDGILEQIPSPKEIQALEKILTVQRGTSVAIRHIIFDQDGTLGGPYEGISKSNRKIIKQLKNAHFGLAILTNDPNTRKKAEAEKLDIPLFGNPDFPKPDPRAFKTVLEKLRWDPQNTIFIGDNPATDKPYIDCGKTNPPSRVSLLWKISRGLVSANSNPPEDQKLPSRDFHPWRERELLLANLLVFPQEMTKYIGLKREFRRRFFRIFVNAGIQAIIDHHPGLITTKHLKENSAQ